MDSNKSRARAKAAKKAEISINEIKRLMDSNPAAFKALAHEIFKDVNGKEIMREQLKAEIIEQAKKVKQNYELSGMAQAKYRESLGELESLKAAATIIGITFEKPESYNDYL